MRCSYASLLAFAVAGTVEAATLQRIPRELGSHVVSPRAAQTCLAPNAIQTASSLTGQEPGTVGIKPGQEPSATDPANFINFCSGQTLTNGQQVQGGSCNGIPMGKIPAKSNMISSIILNPLPGDKVPASQTFNVTVLTQHLDAGFFTNPTTNYYTAPQDLNSKGDIIGHCHVTVQSLGSSLAPSTPPDPTTFAFFKGIDDAGNGKGLLNAVIEGGLTPGFYRVCTLISAQNHQPVNMPVAQRGAQDDCTKFEVVAGAGGSTAPSTASDAGTATSTSASEASGGAKAGSGNNPGKGGGKGNSTTTAAAASASAEAGTGKSNATTAATSTAAAAPTASVGAVVGSGENNNKGNSNDTTTAAAPAASVVGSGKNNIKAKTDDTTIAVAATPTTAAVPTASGSSETGSVKDEGSSNTTTTVAASSTAACSATTSSTSPSSTPSPSTSTPASASASPTATGSASGANVVEMKCGTLGAQCENVTRTNDSRRPFAVHGNTFADLISAVLQSCDVQFKLCMDAVNRGWLPGKKAADCQTQKTACGIRKDDKAAPTCS